jgi:hypothetical protein
MRKIDYSEINLYFKLTASSYNPLYLIFCLHGEGGNNFMAKINSNSYLSSLWNCDRSDFTLTVSLYENVSAKSQLSPHHIPYTSMYTHDNYKLLCFCAYRNWFVDKPRLIRIPTKSQIVLFDSKYHSYVLRCCMFNNKRVLHKSKSYYKLN